MINKTFIIGKTISGSERRNASIYKRTTIDDFAVRIWEKYATGGTTASLLEQSLENEGITLDDACSNVEVCNLQLASESENNLWIRDVEAIIKIYHKCDENFFQSLKERTIIQACLLPFVEYVKERIEHSYSNTGIVSDDAINEYSYMVLPRLAFASDDTILTCARNYEESFDIPYWHSTPIEEAGLRFVRWFYCEGITNLFNTYPLLLKQLMGFLKIHLENFHTFIDNFRCDSALIMNTVLEHPSDMVINHISGNLSDSHNGGKTVMQIELDSSERIYYKPRSLSVDMAWATFVDKLVASDFPTELYAPKVLNMGTYGYMQEIAYCEGTSEEDIHRYYRNAGGLCCIVSMLGGSDFHHENIIACRTVPVLVDVETIITPKPAPLYGLTEVNKNEGASTHVGRTLMLQHWVGDSPETARDIGGFTSEQEGTLNIPSLIDGTKRGAEYYIDDFISGFEATYDFFLNQKEVIRQEGWLNIFAECNFRYVFRRTALYYSLIKHFYSATFMRDSLYFEGALSRFGAGILLNFDKQDTKKVWELVLVEKRSARSGDIPYFISKGNSRNLFSQDGLCINNFFDTSPVELATHNLLSMTHENKSREVEYIKLDLDTCFTQKQFSDGTPILSYRNVKRTVLQKQLCSNDKLFDEVKSLMQIIDGFDLKEGAFDYYAPVRNRKTTRYNVEVLPTDIYSGSLGVLISQAAFSRLSNDKQLSNRVLEKIVKLYENEFHTGRNAAALNLSYTQGLAGLVQATILIANILENTALTNLALKAVLDVPNEYLRRSEEHDFFGGLSGTLYYFSKLYCILPDDKLKEKINILSDELLHRADIDKCENLCWHTENEYKPITGLAHGQSGIAIALLKAWRLTGNRNLYEIAQSLFEYESSCFSASDNNWFDFRKFNVKIRDYTKNNDYTPRFMYGYCSGTPGIGLSRIIAAQQTNSKMYEVDICRAIEFCKNKSIIGNDSLCCGSCAWIDFLIEAALYYGNTTLINSAREICSTIISSNSPNKYILSNINGTSDISLFKGYSGIAYQFMRVMAPREIPSVIV